MARSIVIFLHVGLDNLQLYRLFCAIYTFSIRISVIPGSTKRYTNEVNPRKGLMSTPRV